MSIQWQIPPVCIECGDPAIGWYAGAPGAARSYCQKHGPLGDLIVVKRADWERAQADAARLEAAGFDRACALIEARIAKLNADRGPYQVEAMAGASTLTMMLRTLRAARAPEMTG